MAIRSRKVALVALAAVPALLLAACGTAGDDAPEVEEQEFTLKLAHSYTDDQPQAECGAQVIADEVAAADVGLTIEIFGTSQLGGDADRIASVVSGDIDIDIQGASALGAVYEPISVMDAAFGFDDADHLAAFMASDESDVLVQGFADATGVQTLGAWSAGARHFTANVPITEPADLEGLRMRFPGSPQFLLNAKALGATATEVAYEELYLALQQGLVDGQENPITNLVALNLPEVQDYVSLSAHQLNTNLVIMSSKWTELSERQQEALAAAVDTAVASVTECVIDSEETTLEEWRSGDAWEVIEDVDRDAFSEQAEEFFLGEFTGEKLAAYEAIRATAD